MKRSRRLSVSILIVSALLLNGVRNGNAQSRNPRGKQHKRAAAEEPKDADQRQQEPMVSLGTFQSSQAALSEALRTIQAQEETAAKHDRPEKDNWDKATVIADYLLFLVGCCYTYFAWKQWGEIHRQVDIANETLIQTSRPWIYPEVFIASDFAYDVNGASVDLQFKLRNTGHSVAQYVWVDVRLIVCVPKSREGLHRSVLRSDWQKWL